MRLFLKKEIQNSWKEMLQRTVLCCLVLINIKCLLVGGVTITPRVDYTVPVSYAKDITYHCHGERGEAVFPEVCISRHRCKQWHELGVFNKRGIFIEVRWSNESVITITPRARRHHSMFIVSCVPGTIHGDDKSTQHIHTYEPPSAIRVDPLPEGQVQISWACSTLDLLVYNVTLASLSSNTVVEAITDGCSVIFNLSDYVCDKFNVSVATMDIEDGINSMASITAKLPLAPDVSPIEKSYVVGREGISFDPARVCNSDHQLQAVYYSLYLMSSNTTTMPVDTTTSCSRERCHMTITTEMASMMQGFNFTIEACNNITCRSTGTLSGKIGVNKVLLVIICVLVILASAVVFLICGAIVTWKCFLWKRKIKYTKTSIV